MDLLVSGDLKGILDVLSHMEQSELAVAEFYHACGEIWSQHREFWFGIGTEEHKHVLYIQNMKAIIQNKPQHFEKGRPFNIMAAQTTIKGAQNNTAKLRSGQLQMINAFAIARDMEQSFMEARYNEAVKTEDIEYSTLVKEIIQDTIAHKLEIERMFAAIKK